MYGKFQQHVTTQISEIREAGLYKDERVIATPQEAHIKVAGGRDVLNMCANNYLGLADHPDLVAAAHAALDRWGYGLASVRFICGTQEIHKELEAKISGFLGTEDTILYSSCFDANGGLFETLLTDEDAVISDALNHASIIDGVRLCKARRFRYANNDMDDLEAKLKEAADARFRLIATDGVFSMDGYIANLAAICDLAEKHDALVMVDDSHAVGVVGETGRGAHEHHHVMDRVDVITGTLGKALDILSKSSERLDKLRANAKRFREGMTERGFTIPPGEHPIMPVMLGDALVAQNMSAKLLEKGLYVIGFSYPVVPKGEARIRVQVSAAHSPEDIDFAMNAFAEMKKELGV